jgi:uncharacterized protein (TIGR02466 family)
MIEKQILNLFPIPLYKSKLNREFTSEELLFVEKNKLDVSQNIGNVNSNSTYILNNNCFANLKAELNLRIEDYFKEIISSSNNFIPYITQSWLNFTEKNQHHHKHHHTNSLVSGVLYIKAIKKYDTIEFSKKEQEFFGLETKEWNIWNSQSLTFHVETRDILLFPSTLKHSVATKCEEDTRISLAFNIFIKGEIGNKTKLNELFL